MNIGIWMQFSKAPGFHYRLLRKGLAGQFSTICNTEAHCYMLAFKHLTLLTRASG